MPKRIVLLICGIFFLATANSAKAAEPASLYNQGKFNQAIQQYYQQARHGDIQAYLNLAVIFKDLGLHERALAVLSKAQKKFPQDIRVQLLLGRLYYLTSRYNSAIKVLEKFIRIHPDNIEALITLGLCYQETDNDKPAAELFRKAIALNKNNVLARLSLADLYYRKQQFAESAREYKEVNFIDASIRSVYKCWGDILYSMDNWLEAYKVYQKLSLMDPKNKDVKEKINILSDKIGCDFFNREKKKRSVSKENKLVLVTPVDTAKNMTFVRVGLMLAKCPLEIKCSTPFKIMTKSQRMILSRGQEGEIYFISRNPEGKLEISRPDNNNTVAVGEPLIIKPDSPEGVVTLFDVAYGSSNFWADQEDRSYRGQIEVIAEGNNIRVVNQVSLEEYLYSVVPSEMPVNWPLEALKAQSVAARSEVMAKLGRHRKEGFDLCAEVHCQVYSGVEKENAITNLAVDQTRGLILEYRSKPVDAVYSSCCGGVTQDNIFADNNPIAYFKVTADYEKDRPIHLPLSALELEGWLKEPPKGIYCDIPEYANPGEFRWVRIYTQQELCEMVKPLADLGQIKKIVVLNRNDSGHITQIKIVGSKRSYVVKKELNIRKTFSNLRSSMFKIEIKYDMSQSADRFIFYGGGWGHGVGMCQSGACGMALRGRNFKEILLHYFQGTQFKRLY